MILKCYGSDCDWPGGRKLGLPLERRTKQQTAVSRFSTCFHRTSVSQSKLFSTRHTIQRVRQAIQK